MLKVKYILLCVLNVISLVGGQTLFKLGIKTIISILLH